MTALNGLARPPRPGPATRLRAPVQRTPGTRQRTEVRERRGAAPNAQVEGMGERHEFGERQRPELVAGDLGPRDVLMVARHASSLPSAAPRDHGPKGRAPRARAWVRKRYAAAA